MAKGYRSQMLDSNPDETRRRSYARLMREEMVEREIARSLLMGIDLEVTAIGIYLKIERRAALSISSPIRYKPWLVESLSQNVLRKEINSLYEAMTATKLPKEDE